MEQAKLELYWNDIPIGKDNAITYQELIKEWGKEERSVRAILHELSCFDNGDDYILVRSASGKGFYKTDDFKDIEAYKRECLQKGKSVFAPVKKINRVLQNNADQYTIENNLRVVREASGFTQSEVCKYLQKYDTGVDKPMLSRFENNVCLPTPYQLLLLANFYGCKPADLIKTDVLY